uniref:ZP domain-containing protein n=1 Tax=Rhabditophanes sp. KR3021 TaxID=114890 RepID=A0AC35TIF4_9BILA
MNAGTPFTNTSTASLAIIPTFDSANCVVEYTKIKNATVASFNYTALYGKINELFLNGPDIYDSFFNYEDNATLVAQDPRIFVTCNESVKVIARYNDQARGDMFMVPSIEHAGKNYSIMKPILYFCHF